MISTTTATMVHPATVLVLSAGTGHMGGGVISRTNEVEKGQAET